MLLISTKSLNYLPLLERENITTCVVIPKVITRDMLDGIFDFSQYDSMHTSCIFLEFVFLDTNDDFFFE